MSDDTYYNILPYSSYDDLLISSTDVMSYTNIEKTFVKLLENDKYMSFDNVFPSIWECKWFNDENVDGYKKGDFFWYNTEDYLEFIDRKYNDIYNYAINNIYLNSIIKPYNRNDSEIVELYKKVIDGYKVSENLTLPKLYCLGDIKKSSQIRISKIDNNKYPLDDDNYYKDYFLDNDEIISEIKSEIEGTIDKIIQTHLNDYHLYSDRNKEYIKNIDNLYISKDLNNISSEVVSPYTLASESIKDVNTFDFISAFVIKNDDIHENETRWFRLWKTGELEHGGIVKIDDEDIRKGFKTINFDWVTENNSKTISAPVFTYFVDNNNNYGIFDTLDNANKIENQNSITLKSRYVIQITPIINYEKTEDENETSHIIPTYPKTTDKFGNYLNSEYYDVKNNSFKIKLITESNINWISYHVIGYVKV